MGLDVFVSGGVISEVKHWARCNSTAPWTVGI